MSEMEKLQITDYQVLSELPNPFVFEDGTMVQNEADWRRRREELIKTAAYLQYGTMPPKPEFLNVEPLCISGPNRHGPSGLDTYRIVTGTKNQSVSFIMSVSRPKGDGPFPAVISGDGCWNIMHDREINNLFTENGVMLVKFNRCEIVPDIRNLPRNSDIHKAYPSYDFGAVAAWAWGYSRCVDALETLGIADMDNIAFTGLSRGGKTSLLAGALDERAAIVSTEAPCAGGSCYRITMRGVTVDGEEMRNEELDDLARKFPDWIGPGMQEYIGRAHELPFDEHELKALVAPRILFNSEAKSDIWSGPLCAYQSNIAAREVYKFLGKEENIKWYWREGYHDQTKEDFEMLLYLVLNRAFEKPLPDKFQNIPFDAPEPAFRWRAPGAKTQP